MVSVYAVMGDQKLSRQYVLTVSIPQMNDPFPQAYDTGSPCVFSAGTRPLEQASVIQGGRLPLHPEGNVEGS